MNSESKQKKVPKQKEKKNKSLIAGQKMIETYQDKNYQNNKNLQSLEETKNVAAEGQTFVQKT